MTLPTLFIQRCLAVVLAVEVFGKIGWASCETMKSAPPVFLCTRGVGKCEPRSLPRTHVESEINSGDSLVFSTTTPCQIESVLQSVPASAPVRTLTSAAVQHCGGNVSQGRAATLLRVPSTIKRRRPSGWLLWGT